MTQYVKIEKLKDKYYITKPSLIKIIYGNLSISDIQKKLRFFKKINIYEIDFFCDYFKEYTNLQFSCPLNCPHEYGVCNNCIFHKNALELLEKYEKDIILYKSNYYVNSHIFDNLNHSIKKIEKTIF